MKEVSLFLEKFKNLLLINKETKEVIKEAFVSVLGFEIFSDQIKYKDSIVFVDTSPIVKSEILVKKKELLDFINKNRKLKIKDII